MRAAVGGAGTLFRFSVRLAECVERSTGRRHWRSRAAKLERRWRRRREAGAGAEAEAGAPRPLGRQATGARGPSPETGAAAMAESIVSAVAGRERGAGMRQQICGRPGRASAGRCSEPAAPPQSPWVRRGSCPSLVRRGWREGRRPSGQS